MKIIPELIKLLNKFQFAAELSEQEIEATFLLSTLALQEIAESKIPICITFEGMTIS